LVLLWLLTGVLLLLNLAYCFIKVRSDFKQARRDLAILGILAAAGAVLALFAVERAGAWAMAAMVSEALEKI
jgi:hypothetical protein